jgi:hypothetical protein
MRKQNLPVLILSPLLFLGLVACAAPDLEPAVPETQPAAETPAAAPSPEATLPPAETQAPEIPLPAGSEAVVAAAVADLASRLGISPQEIQTVEIEATEWSDASLDCPEPGMLYIQVITPGFRIVLQARDQSYNYHTDAGTRIVLCGPDGVPILLGTPAAAGGTWLQTSKE